MKIYSTLLLGRIHYNIMTYKNQFHCHILYFNFLPCTTIDKVFDSDVNKKIFIGFKFIRDMELYILSILYGHIRPLHKTTIIDII